jgi:transposase
MTAPANLHLEIQSHRKNHYGLIRSSFRLDGQVQHTSHGRISGLPLQKLKLLQAAFRGDVVAIDSPDAFQILSSREYGASHALLQLARELDLHHMLYSRNEAWVGPALAMIIGRIVYAGSKLALSHQGQNTALWELCGVEGKVDVDKHCYEVMDRLLERQPAIQRTLAKKHLQNGHLVLYDITSSYLEGEYAASDIVAFGYNRDGKRGHEQVVIGLICNEQGCPVGVEVFPGNTQDASTVPAKIAQIQNDYGVSELIFVGDRGMITQANTDKLKGVAGLQTISALSHRQIVELLQRKVITPELFDEKAIAEVLDPEDLKRRYCLCRNPETAKRETHTRQNLLELTRQKLEAIALGRGGIKPNNGDQADPDKPTRAKTPKKTRAPSAETIGARVGRVLQRYKMGKFVQWSVLEGKLVWRFDQDKIQAEERFDGCYVVVANVPPEQMAKAQVVASYRKLSLVEDAFRNLKTVQLEVRPVYHKKDDRIRSHVFLCMLAYYLQWHAQERLQPIFEKDGQGKDRQWTFASVIQRLTTIRSERVKSSGVEFNLITQAGADQKAILECLAQKKDVAINQK